MYLGARKVLLEKVDACPFNSEVVCRISDFTTENNIGILLLGPEREEGVPDFLMSVERKGSQKHEVNTLVSHLAMELYVKYVGELNDADNIMPVVWDTWDRVKPVADMYVIKGGSLWKIKF